MTVVTQSPPPLKLRRAGDSAPSYPMYAFDVKEDLYEAEGSTGTSSKGIRRNGPYQNGNWSLQPAYANALAFMVDLQTGTAWTRSLIPAQEQWSPDILVAKVKTFTFPDEVRWLHCLRVATEPKDQTKYGTIIVDFVHRELTQLERRIYLEAVLPQLGVRTPLSTGDVYLVPEFPESFGEDLWAGLHIMNTAWRNACGDAPFYKGVMVKENNGKYFIQKDDYIRRTPKWMMYPFSNPWAEAPEL